MKHQILIATIMRPHGETGVQTYVQALISEAEAQGKNVKLVTPYSYHMFLVVPVFAVRRLIDPLSGALSVWWYRFWHGLFLQLALKRMLRHQQSVLVYAQCPVSAEAAMRARRSSTQRVFMALHFNSSQAFEWAAKGKIKSEGVYASAILDFESNTLSALDGIVYASDLMFKQLVERIPRLRAVTSFKAPNFFKDPAPYSTATWMGDLLCVGTLESRKNQSYAIDIIAAAKSIGRRLTLTIVGEGPDSVLLRDRAKMLGVSDQVLFTGFVQNASSLCSRHTAYLHTALVENFPMILVESLAFGTPIFATRAGGVPEVFRDGLDGRLIPLDDPKHCVEVILEWLDDPQTMKLAKSNARQHYLQNYESGAVAGRLLAFMDP